MKLIPNETLLREIFEEQENLSNEVYIEKIIKRVEVLTQLTNSLNVDGVQMPAWKTFSETVIIKICFHISSLFCLFRGSELPFKHTKSKYVIFDEPSIYSLFRTITENYLTFYYLFSDGIDDNEKYFRFLVYEYCGLRQRQSFKVTLPEHKQKLNEEGKHLEQLRTSIKESEYFKILDAKIQKKIVDGVQPKLKTWKKLIKDARLNIGFDLNLYGYKSSYSHSEYLSMLQIRTNNYEFIPHQRKSHFVLFLTHMLVCRMIVDLSNLFPSVKIRFNEIDRSLKMEIEFLSENLAIDTNLENK